MIRTTRNSIFAIAVLTIAACYSSAAFAQERGASQAQATVKENAERILFFAHPTVTYSGVDYVGSYRMADGKNAICMKFRFVSFWGNDGWTKLYFVHGETGSIQDIRNAGTSGIIQPFFASNVAIAIFKEWIKDNEQLQKNPLIKDAIDRADAKSILLLLLP